MNPNKIPISQGREYAADATSMSDECLLQQASQGDEAAFETLVKRYEGKVINLIYRYTHNADEAEDIAAEVFFRIWKYAARFKGTSKFSTWGYRIAVNVCLNYRKASRSKPLFEYIDAVFDTEHGETTKELPEPAGLSEPDTITQKTERESLINQAIDQLPPQQKIAFILSWFEGNSYQEIAHILNTSLSSVESLLFRAKENLRKILAPLKEQNKL
jgi:RNA polymerase sigma-70 factor (ECF subfamily)